MFTEENFNEFWEYITNQNLAFNSSDWYLGLLNTEKNNELYKLQLGEKSICLVKLSEYDASGNRHMCFEYVRLCDESSVPFSPQDLFLPINVSIAPFFRGVDESTLVSELDVSELGVFDSFIIRVLHELKKQRISIENSDGMMMYLKWEKIYGDLIRTSVDDRVRIVVSWQSTDSGIAYIDNMSDVYELMERNYLEKKSNFNDFYIMNSAGRKYWVSVDNSSLKLDKKDVVFAQNDVCKESELFLYCKENNHVMEKLMKSLHELRMGYVDSYQLFRSCMNAQTITESIIEDISIGSYVDPRLSTNESQKNAVANAFLERNIFMIQGPPGTGKTTVIRELVNQQLLHFPDSKILISSQSNAAVDNALEGVLSQLEADIVRCGSDEKIDSKVSCCSLSKRCQEYIDTIPQTSNDTISMKWKSLVTSANGECSNFLKGQLIRNYRIIGSTFLGLLNRSIGVDDLHFDLAIIDEAGKAMPAELIIPILRSQKVVIIGDQMQLPPVIDERLKSVDRGSALDELCRESLFGKMIECIPDSNKAFLDTQYRMPSVIGSIVSDLFYSGKLLNGQGTESKQPIYHNSNFVFYNFDGIDSYCERVEDKSPYNKKEAEFVARLLKQIRNKNTSCSIAVITPYAAQKRRILNLISGKGFVNVKIDTIDQFQGQEADIVIFCTTRSKKATPFYYDNRRINVALSRAKNELIILGKMSYFYAFSGKSCMPQLAGKIKEHAQIYNKDEMQS